MQKWEESDIIRRHIRTCQECFYEQGDRVPVKVTDAWLEKKCKKCKSKALDYGSEKMFSFKLNRELSYEEVYDDED